MPHPAGETRAGFLEEVLLLSAMTVVSSACLRLLIFLLEILIPACASFQPSISYGVLCI